jgi:iron(II)-dependent oxidoreductase
VKHLSFPDGINRQTLLDWFREGRERTRRIFSIPRQVMYYERPIALRNPIVFYEGHLPAFAVNTLIKLALRQTGINENYELLFARGIDPDSPEAVMDPGSVWPSRQEVQAYGATADSMIERALLESDLEDESVPQLRGGEAALAILEHEQMHQETLLYMLHNMPLDQKIVSAPLTPSAMPAVSSPVFDSVEIPAGFATVGADREEIGFGWDNEFPAMRVEVPAFTIDRHNVTNGQYLEFMEVTGAAAPWFWEQGKGGEWLLRGMFTREPLPRDWPVYVTHDEAVAYANWRGKRLPSEGEYHRAAHGTPEGAERMYPWGNEAPDATRGNFGFRRWDPVPVGSYPAGASAWGVHDLVGNGWEWTSTVFDGLPGFTPMASYPVYSNDFFDGQHYVLKGASPVTANELIRRSLRNWFRPNYPYLYATFRCVS